MPNICASRGSAHSISRGSPMVPNGIRRLARRGDRVESFETTAAMKRQAFANRAARVAAFAAMTVLVCRPAFAQIDLTGKWASRSGQDAQERGPGPDPV